MKQQAIFIEEISLCEQYSSRPQELVCRTCTKTSDKFWAHNKVEIVKAKSSNDFEASDYACSPSKIWDEVKVLNTTDHNNRVVAIDQESQYKTRAFVETCGHDVRRQCLSCDHFLPIEVDVAPPGKVDSEILFKPVEKNGKLVLEPFSSDGSPVRKWKVAVGGSCSLPVEGIEKNGNRLYCDFSPKGKRVESPSCANCYYLDYAGDQWQFNYLELNDNAALTPWEKEIALKESETLDVPTWQSLGLALWKKQTQGNGRVLSFTVQILRKDYHQGQLKYKVRFETNNTVAIIAAYDARVYINDDTEIGYNRDHDYSAVRRGVAEIMYPFHQQFNLPDNLKVVKRKWPQLPDKIAIENPIWADLVDTSCPRCSVKKNQPCYYHSKAPRQNIVQGSIEFTKGHQTRTEYVFPAHGIMHVEKRFGDYVAVDGNGNLPEPYSDNVANATVFRIYLQELIRVAKAKYGNSAVKSITQQYHQVTSLLHFTSPVKVRPSWLRTSTEEPSKPRCSNPAGLNLRKVFMDSFGSERTDIDFDLGPYNTAIVEEELRVGKRQHAQTPQRLQEEMLATLTSHPRYREELGGVVESGVIWPTDTYVTSIPAIGGMYDESGNPITSTEEFVNRLDDEVALGMAGEVSRNVSVRQQLYGYQLSRGYYGKRRGSDKTHMPAFDEEMVIFADQGEPDQIDATDAWRCVNCDRNYDQVEIVNWLTPTCECGHALYKNHMSRVGYNARATGGIGNALVMDNDSMRQKQMLYANLCPKWRLNTQNSVITLSDLSGGTTSTVAETPVEIISSGPTVHKVGGFLSEEHMQANREYELKRKETYEKREAFKEQYPDATIEEISKRFPLPYGVTYVEKAAGSLAKMGGI